MTLSLYTLLPLAFVSYIGLLLLYRFVKWYTSPLRKLPGPRNRGKLLGNHPEIRKEPFLDPHKRWLKELAAAGHDNIRGLHYNQMFWQSSVLVLDREIIRILLTAPYGKDKLRFYKSIRFLEDIFGNGLVTLQGPDWMRHRRMLQPSFNTKFLTETLDASVPSKVNRFVESWRKAVEATNGAASREETEIELSAHLSSLTLDVIGDVAFNHDFHAVESVEDWSKRIAASGNGKSSNGESETQKDENKLTQITDPFVVFLTKSLRFNLMSVVTTASGLSFLNRYINPQLINNRRKLDEAVDRIVSAARTDNTKDKSILHLMLKAKDTEGDGKKEVVLRDDELRDEVKTFVVAGHETTSTWLYFCMYALSKYPDVQTKVYQDIVKHAPLDSVKLIQSEHVEKMDYVNAFMQEVLRLYPPVGLFSRFNTFDEDFDGMQVPAGTRLIISPHLLHRDPRYWDKPEEFLPERWLNETKEDEERRRFAFLPFAAGGRGCIGQKFATLEAQLILAPLLRAFRVSIATSQRDTDFTFSSAVTMKTKPSLKIGIKKR